MKASGLRTFMDAITRHEWDQKIIKRDVPELAEENITALFGGLLERRGDMFRAGVVNIFRLLRPRYASHSKWQFEKKLIVNQVLSRPPFKSLNHERFNLLDDFLRAFYVLDGLPEPDHRQGCYSLADAAMRHGESSFETPYFRATLYTSAQTCHINITRLDLLDKLNAILAAEYGKALPNDGQPS